MILDFLWYCKALEELTGVQVTPVLPEFIRIDSSGLKEESIFHLIFKPLDSQPNETFFYYVQVDPTEYKQYAGNHITQKILDLSPSVLICNDEGENILDLSQEEMNVIQQAKIEINNGNITLQPDDVEKEWLKHSILYWRYKINHEDTYEHHINTPITNKISRIVSYISCFQQLQDSLQNDVGELE